MYRELSDKRGEADALYTVSEVHKCREHHELAAQAARDMMDIATELQDNSIMVSAAKQLACICTFQRDPLAAIKVLTEARAHAKKNGDVTVDFDLAIHCAEAYMSCADVARAEGKPTHEVPSDKALKCAKEALALANRLHSKQARANALHVVADASLVHRRPEAAEKFAEKALALYRELGDAKLESAGVVLMAEIHFCKGEKAKAMELARKGSDMAQAARHGPTLHRVEMLMKAIEGHRGDKSESADQSMQQKADAADESAEVAKKRVDPEQVKKMVGAVIEGVLAGETEDIVLDTPLMDAGLDSLASVAFRNELSKAAGVTLPASMIFDN